MKILAVDPGERRIGLAISDPTGTFARPLKVLIHKTREIDSQTIVELAADEGAEMIVVGWALNSEGEVGYQARKSKRLAMRIQGKSVLPVRMWDESGTTQKAIKNRVEMGVSRKKRRGHLDDVAASFLLQDFIDFGLQINEENEVKDEE